ncbi:N-acetylmuramoyl-L-alanine amidase AmiC precursor [mine drainage metagenome]|uniref:N-acetylmuramoyl-L-alanine amidase AmiC n=1 Tax=mine drainage metagenome TaxID=410659 RepID=A0A1J5SBX3_9ZZZZ
MAQDTPQSYWLGRSTGKLPSLAYGMGDDRLGGAKMGYVDTNIVFKIIDSTKEMYVVQLSKNHTAFIDKAHIVRDSTIKEKPFYLSNSWKVHGTDSCYDILAISLDERLPYKSWMEVDPSKIIFEIYGVQSNTNWITQLSSLKEIKNVYYNQIEDDVLQVTIDLRHQQHWGYSVGYAKKKLVIKVKRQPPVLLLKNLKIAIDAGHGGTNSGASGIKTNASEKTYTLKFAKELEKLLRKQKVNVVMTRRVDTSFDIKDRVLFLQQENPDVLISLHLNSSNNVLVKGSSTYYKHIGFRPLSQSILKRMTNIRMDEFGNVGSFNFTLNAPTDFINCLLEIGFLSNEDDEKRIVDPRFQAAVARQIVSGLNDWLKDVKSKN